MRLRFLIVTDPENDWVGSKINDIKKIMLLSPDITEVDFDISYEEDLVPEIEGGRISHDWFEKNITKNRVIKGYLGAIFVLSDADGEKHGLDDGLRGSYLRDGDEFMEMWVRSDRNQVVKFKDGTKRDKFTKVVPHEIGHGLKEFGYTNLEVHDFDYKTEKNNLEGFYKKLRVAPDRKSNLTLQKFTLMRAVRALFALKNSVPVTPLPKPIWENVSQEYGVKNNLYPKTGRHIGLDLRSPIGTPVVARLDGRVSVGGHTKTLGYFCHFVYEYKGHQYTDRYLHLKGRPSLGAYEKGAQIALTGNSGLSSGPHCHVETWIGDVDTIKINEKNWNQLTRDPRIIK